MVSDEHRTKEMTVNEVVLSAFKWLLGGGGVLALYFGIATIALRRRAHLIDVYQSAFALLDSGEMRAARRYVYNLEKADPDRKQYLRKNGRILKQYRILRSVTHGLQIETGRNKLHALLINWVYLCEKALFPSI